MGPGMVPFERALVSSYRPSIVIFPLSLCVSEILPLLFSRTPLFPYPTSSLPKTRGRVRAGPSFQLGTLSPPHPTPSPYILGACGDSIP